MALDAIDPVDVDWSEPPARSTRCRIEMTVGCGDARDIPKVPDAGKIIMSGGTKVQVMHNGIRVLAGGYHGDWMAEIIERLSGHHEPQEELAFHEVLKQLPERPVMIELGCFWSYYSLWCLNQRPRARVIGVEPDLKSLDIGRMNAELNGRTIEFINAAAGARSLPPQPFVTETSGTIDLPHVCVPDLMQSRGIDHLDVLHCDTQGAETAILQSCQGLFEARRVSFCVVSTHHHYISGDPLTHQRCLALLKKAGGQILVEHDVFESFSGDGLIVAYFGAEPLAWPDLPMSYNRYSESLFRNPLFDLSAAMRAAQAAG